MDNLTDSVDTIQSEIPTLFNSKLTKYVMVKKSIEFFGLVYLVFGLILGYSWGCIIMDIKSNYKDRFYFWEPICFMYSLVTLVICIFIVRYKIFKYKHSDNDGTNADENSQPYSNRTMSLILVPLYLIAVCFLSIMCIRDYVIIPCNGYLTFLISLVILVFLTVSTILITQTSTYPMVMRDFNLTKSELYNRLKITEHFKAWQYELYDIAIILFTTIGMINLFILNITFQHVLTFVDMKNSKIFQISFNTTSCFHNLTGVGKNLSDILINYNAKFRPLFLLYLISVIFFLIGPLVAKFKLINQIEHLSLELTKLYNFTENIDDEDNDFMENEDNIQDDTDYENMSGYVKLPSFKLPNLSLLVCITILSICVLIFILVFESIEPLRYLISIIYVLLHTLVYVIGCWLSIIHLQEILTWPSFRKRSGKMIDHCLVWIGAIGQLLVAFGAMTNSVDLLSHSTPPNDWKAKMLRCLGLILSCTLIIQIYLQTVLLAVALERKWEKPQEETWVEILCPAVGMMGLNLGLLILSTVSIKYNYLGRSQHFYSGLFISGCKFIGQTIGSVQRLHASLLFGNMIIYTHN